MALQLRANVLSNRRGGNVTFVIEQDITETIDDDLDDVAETIRKAIRQSPYWPVRTGRSRAAFDVDLYNRHLLITNRYRYAYIVEALSGTRTGAGKRWGTGPRYPITETIALAIESTDTTRQPLRRTAG